MSTPDTPTPEQDRAAPEYQRVYDALPEEQREQIVEAAQDDAADLMEWAEMLYRESELAKVREAIGKSEEYGATMTDQALREAEDRALAELDPSPPKEFIQAAEAEWHRSEKLVQAVESEVASEPPETQAALRDEIRDWMRFLEVHGETADIVTRAREALESAKAFERAVEDSSLSETFKEELRKEKFDLIEERARERSQGAPDPATWEGARQWLLKMVRAEGIKPEPEPVRTEVWNYTKFRLQRWRKFFLGSRKRVILTAIAAGAAAVLSPVAAVTGTAIGVAALYEAGRGAVLGTVRGMERGGDRLARRSRERRIRRRR